LIQRARKRWPDLLALFGITALSLAYLWPLVRRFSSAMAGDGFDRYVFQWTNWWVTKALAQGQRLYHTEVLFHPQGADLHFLSYSWLNTFVWWSLQGVLGKVAAYNFTVWWSWPLAGFGAYLLGRQVLDDRRAAFIAGIIYAFYPYHFAQRNHLNLLSIQWIPFSLLFLVRATKDSRWLDGALSGLFFAFSGLSSWHLLTLSGLLGGLWVLYASLSKQMVWSAKTWRALLALVITVAAVTGPFLAPLVWKQVAGPADESPYLGKETETQTDLVAYFLPNLYHPLWGDAAAPVHRRFLRAKDHAVALGYVPLGLLICAVVRWGKERTGRFWLIGFAVFWLLALGPFPRINGEPYPSIPLPYRLVGWSFPVRSLRSPARFNIIVGLCLCVVGGASARRLMSKLPRRLSTTAFVVITALIMLEYWSWPFPTRVPNMPAGYAPIIADSGDFAIADLPISNDLAKQYMSYQTVHQRPTVTGHVSRPPEEAYAFIESNDLLRSMWRGRQPDPQGDARADLAALADANVRYLVAHKPELSTNELASLHAYLRLEPVYDDQEIRIYSTTSADGH